MECIFCKIVRGDMPSTKVYEDDSFLAFLDIRPLSPGHTLVIPKKHYRWVWDVEDPGAYFEVATKIAKAAQEAFGVSMVMSKIVGDEVPHAHIWVFPAPKETRGDPNDFSGNAAAIKQHLPKH